MFRKMRRFKQQISDEACEKVLLSAPRGVLAVHGEDGYPYALPINFLYEDGKIYFHGAVTGHKIDAMKKDPRVSFCVMDEGYLKEGKRGLNINSVIIFGTVRFIDDHEEALDRCRHLGLKYFPGETDYVDDDIRRNENHLQMIELTIDHMTGKLVNES
ncbi:MAG: pyridoxamine 5'-phosphate oxidase family protein [Eubacteriales bacterium]|jgi:nitroimidazol reductase NimA-like FMN-containing flavoprotein (pyridoxamine 5'-phosphate oxidase superfamily)